MTKHRRRSDRDAHDEARILHQKFLVCKFEKLNLPLGCGRIRSNDTEFQAQMLNFIQETARISSLVCQILITNRAMTILTEEFTEHLHVWKLVCYRLKFFVLRNSVERSQFTVVLSLGQFARNVAFLTFGRKDNYPRWAGRSLQV